MLKKNISWIIIIAVSVCSFSDVALAGGNFVFQTDSVNLNHQESYFSHDMNFYVAGSEKFGLGVNTTFSPENDYLKIKPFATWGLGNGFNLVGGYSTESLDKSFIHVGLEYFTSLGKSDTVFISSCFYFGLDGRSKDFSDSFLEVKHDLGNDFALALEAVFDYWPESGAKWMLIGPVVHYKVSEKVNLFGRVAGESDSEQWTSFDIRIGLKYFF